MIHRYIVVSELRESTGNIFVSRAWTKFSDEMTFDCSVEELSLKDVQERLYLLHTGKTEGETKRVRDVMHWLGDAVAYPEPRNFIVTNIIPFGERTTRTVVNGAQTEPLSP